MRCHKSVATNLMWCVHIVTHHIRFHFEWLDLTKNTVIALATLAVRILWAYCSIGMGPFGQPRDRALWAKLSLWAEDANYY